MLARLWRPELGRDPGAAIARARLVSALGPLIALLLYRSRIGLAAWGGVLVATAGLAMLSGIHAGSATGDLLVLAAAAVYSLQIVLMERYAPCHDALAFTFVEMAAAFAGLLVVALAHGDLSVPHGWTVWGALLVTGVFASALGYLVQTWAQRRTSATRTALVFTMEPVWTAFFGYTLACTNARDGFFVVPADPKSNNIRLYVLRNAAHKILVGAQAEALAKGMGQQAA